MKKIYLMLLFVLPVSAWAQGSGAMFEEAKSNAISQIDKKINQLNKAKSCMESASDQKAVKSCRKANREAMKGIRAENKMARKEYKKKRKAMRKEMRKKGKKHMEDMADES